MKKKNVCLAVAAICLLLAFVGCGRANTPQAAAVSAAELLSLGEKYLLVEYN